MVEPVDPPPPIWESIKGKLKGIEQSPGAVRPDGEPAISVEKTRATLEALEAQLREEGLDVPSTAGEAELPGSAATRATDWEETSDSQASASLEPKQHPDGSAGSRGRPHDADCHCAGRFDRRLAIFSRSPAAAIARRERAQYSPSDARAGTPAGASPALSPARIPIRRIATAAAAARRAKRKRRAGESAPLALGGKSYERSADRVPLGCCRDWRAGLDHGRLEAPIRCAVVDA
jgi:hypothetical protein